MSLRGWPRMDMWHGTGASLLRRLNDRSPLLMGWRYTQAAAMLDSIERSQPFIDGNKRVGFLMVALVLRGNGVDESHVSDDQWFDLITATASTHLPTPEIAALLQQLIASGQESQEPW